MGPKCIRRNKWLFAALALTLVGASASRDGDDGKAAWEQRLRDADVATLHSRYDDAAKLLEPEPPAALAESEIGVKRLFQQSTLALFQKRFDDALRLSKAAESLAARRAGTKPLLGQIYGRRADIEYARGEFVSAEKFGLEALGLAQRGGDKAGAASAGGTLIRACIARGHYRDAIDYGRRALLVGSSVHEGDPSGNATRVAKLRLNLGWAYVIIGEYQAAEDEISAAAKTFASLRINHDLAPALSNLGDIARQRGDFPAALTYYRQAVELGRSEENGGHRDLAEFLDNEAATFLAIGDEASLKKARIRQREALASKPSDDELLRSRLIDAQIDAASNDIESAIGKAQAIISDAAAGSRRRWEAQARLASFYVQANRSGDAARTFRAALDSADRTRQSIKSVELQLPFGALVRDTYDAWVEFLAARSRDEDALAATEESRAQTLHDAFEAEAAATREPQRIAARRGATLLVYWLAPRCSYVWVVTPQAVKMLPLPPRKVIEDEVAAYSKELFTRRAGAASTLQRGARLFEMLVPPTARLRGAARLVVVPDGVLHSFNPETLVASANRYWIEDVTIETAPSLALLGRDDPQQRRSDAMLLVGNPAQADPSFPPLANAAAEVRLVSRRFGASCTTLTGAAATPSAYVNAALDRFAFIHFVAHGVASRQWPLDSAVILARDRNSHQLYGRDIIDRPLRARLVTISSCVSAGNRNYAGEGLVGLAWAFLRAGSKQVIAALWDVDDATTPALMDDLYRGIRGGLDPAAALRRAKLALVHARGAERLPRFWAPFVLYSGS